MVTNESDGTSIKQVVFPPMQATERDYPKPGVTRVAVFVLHGMGQQVRFETLDKVVQGLVGASPKAAKPHQVRVGTVALGEPEIRVQRAELDLENNAGQAFEAHIYEGYWAHFTEGRVNGRDVLNFLFSGALNGLKKWQAQFTRWMFGRRVPFEVRPTALWGLLLAFTIAISVVVINALIGIMASSYLLRTFARGNLAEGSGQPATIPTTWPSPILVNGFTSIMIVLILYSLFVGAYLWVLARPTWKASRPRTWEFLAKIAHHFLVPLWGGLVVLFAGCLSIMLLAERFYPPLLEKFTPDLTWGDFEIVQQEWLVLGLWIALLFVSYLLRNLVVETIGDVAAYLSSHKLDRFMNIRFNIQSEMLRIAQAIYSSGGTDAPTYDRVAFLGHSLGSVVAYDTLNRLISRDELNCRELRVVERTKVLLTFGSPLDKTAYIFRFHSQHTTDTREALASAVQPLIQNYELFRQSLHWINVYSWRDIISGDLDYYDDRDNHSYGRFGVHNVEDMDSQTPLIAHVEYWDNPTVFRELYRSLFRSETPDSKREAAPEAGL